MSDSTIDPPISIADISTTSSGDFNGEMKIYLSYDYLPSRNFYLLSKNINELYEYVFEIIHNRPISKNELLVLEKINTGNSIEVFYKILQELKPPKSVKITLGIVSGLIIGHAEYHDYKKKSAETEYTIAQTSKTKAEIELVKSQTDKNKVEIEKIKLENERLILENELKRKNISEDYIEKVLTIESLKKINRKLNSIEKQIMNKPINVAVINGTAIYNNYIEK